MPRSIQRWSFTISSSSDGSEPWFTRGRRIAGAARAGALIEGGARWAGLPVQECCGFSGTSLSLSAFPPSSGSERPFIFRIIQWRWTFTVVVSIAKLRAYCGLRRHMRLAISKNNQPPGAMPTSQ
jgi:hypothetical protein